MTRRRRAAQLAAGLAVGLVLVELGFMLRDHGAFPHVNFYRSDDRLGVRLQPEAEERISFAGNPVTLVRTNSDGYRGANWPPPSTNEILVLGDSQVFGLGVDEEQTFSARLGAATGRPVRNAGVPTYGPDEYNAVLAELLPVRTPKTVIWTVNLSNDLFEAARPNRERHVVWDGWAVRKEHGPGSQRAFPGRDWLMRRSHAVYAFRGLWLRLHGGAPEEAVPSEGSWRELAQAGTASDPARKQVVLAARAAKDAALTKTVEDRDALYADLVQRVGDRVYAAQHALANPGDLLSGTRHRYAEPSRPVPATASEIQRATVTRNEALLVLKRKNGEAGAAVLTEYEKLERRRRALYGEPEPKPTVPSALRAHLATAKALCDAHGAELVVMILPLDVQVSQREWAKYEAPPLDLAATHGLVDDVVADATRVGARAIDTWAALAAAEPGAFLDGDLHLSPRGHAAVAETIASALAGRVAVAPKLPEGRSPVPSADEWRVASHAPIGLDEPRWPRSQREAGPLDKLVGAGCSFFQVREWLRISCLGASGQVVKPGRSDAMMMNTVHGVTLVAAVLVGDSVVVKLRWKAQAFEVGWEWAVALLHPSYHEYNLNSLPPVVKPTEAEQALCACHRQETGASTCADLVGSDGIGCSRYAGDCAKLLLCARGDWAAPPACTNGEPTGALARCRATAP